MISTTSHASEMACWSYTCRACRCLCVFDNACQQHRCAGVPFTEFFSRSDIYQDQIIVADAGYQEKIIVAGTGLHGLKCVQVYLANILQITDLIGSAHPVASLACNHHKLSSVTFWMEEALSAGGLASALSSANSCSAHIATWLSGRCNKHNNENLLASGAWYRSAHASKDLQSPAEVVCNDVNKEFTHIWQCKVLSDLYILQVHLHSFFPRFRLLIGCSRLHSETLVFRLRRQ